MNTICLSKKLPVILVMAVLLFLMMSVSAEDAVSLSSNPEFLGFMEQIAEDMEEIHHDMHKVAFSLRLSAVSQVGIAIILLLMLINQVMTKRR